MLFLAALSTPQSPLTPRHLDESRFETLPVRIPFQRDERLYLKMARHMGGGVETEQALSSTLEALARCQTEDGSWVPSAEGSRQEVTGLALLAYLGAGWNVWDQKKLQRSSGWRFGLAISGAPFAQADPPYHLVVRRGVNYLLGRQHADGFIGERDAPQALRDHAIAAKVLSEACDSKGLAILRHPTEQAIAALVAEAPSWTKGNPEVAGWTAQALRSAKLSCFSVDDAAWEVLKAPLLQPAAGNPRDPAIDLLVWCLVSRGRRNPEFSLRPPPIPSVQPKHPRERYWTALALSYWDGSGLWLKWQERMKAELLSTKPVDPESLAYRALTVEAYYRDTFY
jgi:hypothetical protein